MAANFIQVGPKSFMTEQEAAKQGKKRWTPPAQAAKATTPAPKPAPAAVAPAPRAQWSKQFSAFAAKGDYSISAAMDAGFTNPEIHKMMADGWVIRPEGPVAAVQQLGPNYHEAKRRGLVG